MSNTPEPEFDLEQLFLPAWAKQTPKPDRYAQYKGEPDRRDDRGQDRHGRPARRPGPAPARGASGPRFQQGRDRQGPPERHQAQRDGGRDQRPLPPAAPLPEVNVAFVADDLGVDSVVKQIRMTGRAFQLFDIAQLILQKPERHEVTLSVKKRADGSVIQPLFLFALDDTLWLSEDEAVRHGLERHFATFYQPERTQIDPPKGTYTFVAQCGMSGVVLGPPNYHDYQNQLRKLHAERFARLPFEAFKAQVRIVKDEAVVKKWVEGQSWKTEFICLNLPEPLRLGTREEVEKHFRQVHLPNIIKPVESHRLTGVASRNLRDRGLVRLLRHCWEEQRRFPLQLATVLSQQFASRGLQFFKVNKSVTHVAVARPHFLDLEATPVSDGIRRIVEFINSHPKCTHKQLLKALAPAPQVTAPTAAPAGESAVAPTAIPGTEPTPEMAAVMSDLHWLVHQGHVIEFANGILETAKKPLPRPAKPAPPAARPPVVTPTEAAAAPAQSAVSNEGHSPSSEAVVTDSGVAPEVPVSPPSVETTTAPAPIQTAPPADSPVEEKPAV